MTAKIVLYCTSFPEPNQAMVTMVTLLLSKLHSHHGNHDNQSPDEKTTTWLFRLEALFDPKSWGATISFHDIWGFQTLRGVFPTTTMAVWALIDRTQPHTGWQWQAVSSGKCSPCIYDMLGNLERGWHSWLPSAWNTHCASWAVAVWVCCYHVAFRLLCLWCERWPLERRGLWASPPWSQPVLRP